MFRQYQFQRSIASLVIITFSSLTLYPCAVSAQVREISEKAGGMSRPFNQNTLFSTRSNIAVISGGTLPPTAKQNSTDERLSKLLKQIQDELKATTPITSSPAKSNVQALSAVSNNSELVNQHVSNIRSANSQIKTLYSDIDQSFKDTEKHLKDAKSPAEILARHSKAVTLYQSRQAEFDKIMNKVVQADDSRQNNDRQTALTELNSFMDKYPNARPYQNTDPNKLPFGNPSNKVRKPIESKAQYQASLFPPSYNKIMLAGPIPDGLVLAQATLPDVPTAQDTAETEDVQLTPSIKAQAAALNNNPVQIYNWVRNHINFIPSYGSIQGSELTFQNKRGNAFDTASLLIALYRAAGIPARYVYGTIDISADRAMNWVGGVTKAEAAQNLLGLGGIPNAALVSGGKTSSIRMEHVWVEAFVDYIPSRGAVNKNPNTWVPVDASFKQYNFTKGVELDKNVTLNGQDLLGQIEQGATVNNAGGYVQNINQVNLQTQVTSFQNQVMAYVDSQRAAVTVGTVLGAQKIKAENYSILMGSLPYKVVVTGNTFQALPDNLRWKFKTNIYPADGISTSDSALIELSQSTARLAGKKITLSFIPATQADQDLINSYLPKTHADNSPIQPSELPTSLPGYLLNMKAEFRVDGQVVATTSGSFTLGSSVRQANQYYNPSTGAWAGGEDNDITVGEYNAIGLDLQGFGVGQLQTLQDRIAQTSDKLVQFQQNGSNPAQLNGLTKEDLIGDFVQAGILTYFVHVDASDDLIARSGNRVKNLRMPSYGRFLTMAQPHYFFGVVRGVSFPGVMIDVDYLRYQVAATDGNSSASAQYMRQAGASASSAENTALETMFRNPALAGNDPAQLQAASAVKSIAIAAVQGQKIYTLNLGNQSQHSTILQSLQLDQDVKSEISNALAAGKEVTTHEKNVSVGNWTGSGYVILDPDNGAGAYKIAGGANGGTLTGEDVSPIVFNMLNINAVVPTAALLTSAATRLINAITFAETWLSGMFDCYKTEILGAVAIIIIAVAVGMLIGSVSAGTGAAPAFLVVMAVLAPQSVAAAQNRECKLECSKAKRSQLDGAIPIPILDPEQFKIEEGFGPPTSPYDICACKDGSLIIYQVNECGRIKPNIDFHITDRRWK